MGGQGVQEKRNYSCRFPSGNMLPKAACSQAEENDFISWEEIMLSLQPWLKNQKLGVDSMMDSRKQQSSLS